nr:fumarylacetoacetate hydrolase family protein [Sphingomonas sp. CDS-1]
MVNFEQLVSHIDQPGVDSDPALDIRLLAPDISEPEALRVQLAVKRQQAARGDRIVGHQASFTSAAVQRAFPDAPVPMVGTLLASLLRSNGETVMIGADPTVIESEVGAILKRDLEGPHVSPAEVLSAIEGFCPAIEIAPVRPGVREGKYSWPHMIAVQKAAGGYVVVGDRLTPPGKIDLRLEGCLVSIDGLTRAGAVGFEAMGNPLKVIAAIAARLHAAGEKLHAGQLIITGSLPPPQLIGPEDRSTLVEFTTLGSVGVRFER